MSHRGQLTALYISSFERFERFDVVQLKRPNENHL